MFAYYLHNLDPIIFRIYDNVGPRWYGLAYVLAFICGYLVFLWLAKRGYADLPPQRVGDFITGAALFGVIIGGRLGYVFFYNPEMLRAPLSILRVWEGGMSSHGGMIGLLLFTLYYAHRHKISWMNLGDNLGVTAPVGLFFGRCANFINGELYGRITTVPWAIQFQKELLDHPTEANRAIASCSRLIHRSVRRKRLSPLSIDSRKSQRRCARFCLRGIRPSSTKPFLKALFCLRFCGSCAPGRDSRTGC